MAAKLKAAIITPVLYGMFRMNNTRMSFVQKRSICNQFYSDLITPLQKDISRPDTTIHCFYAVKMGEKYSRRYRMHFKNPDIRRHDMQHEELLVVHPGQWVEEIRACCSQ